MIVYELGGLVNEHQGLLPYNDSVWDKGLMDFNGETRLKSWKPLRMKVDNVRGKKPDIFFASGLVVIPSWSVDRLRPILERSGELLPVFWNRESGFLYNLTRLGGYINESESSWLEDENGPFLIDKPAFQKSKIPKTVLFGICKIPGIFGVGDSPKSPISKLRSLDLKGVIFVPIWDSKRGVLDYDS